MKKILLIMVVAVLSAKAFAQEKSDEISGKNSWLKVGLNAGVPFGNLSDASNFTLGLDLKGQIMSTRHVGLGIATGYNNFFPKSGYSNFGTIPLGAFVRYYPASTGFFAGLDVGYSFLTGDAPGNGGVYARPQLGYHNYSWNFFGFYNGIFRSSDNGGSLQFAGVGVAYNIHFKK